MSVFNFSQLKSQNTLIMKKSILNLGKALNRSEQQTINGGNSCYYKSDCGPDQACTSYYSGGNLFVGECVWLTEL